MPDNNLARRLVAEAVPFAVGASITGAYWFTASTSFANPAVTLARAVTDTFSGIRPADATGFMTKPNILILCTGNSARSQMAEGLMRHAVGVRFEVASAGTQPSIVRREAIAVMQEIGIDISGHRSKSIDEFAGREFTYVITVCDNANAACPVFLGKTIRLRWPIEDPAAVEGAAEERKAAFREARDIIRDRITSFHNELQTP